MQDYLRDSKNTRPELTARCCNFAEDERQYQIYRNACNNKETLQKLFEDYTGGEFQTKLADLGNPVGNEQW